MTDREKELVRKLCDLYEYYGAVTESIDRQFQRMGTYEHSRPEIIRSVKKIKKELGLDE